MVELGIHRGNNVVPGIMTAYLWETYKTRTKVSHHLDFKGSRVYAAEDVVDTGNSGEG